MNDRTMRQLLLSALILMAMGGLYLHLRIHPFLVPVEENPGQTVFVGSFVAATFFPLLDLIVVSLLFTSRRTAVYGYVLNGMLVIFGTVLMTHFSLVKLSVEPPQPLYLLLFKSTLPDIALAWADFLVGATLYHTWLCGNLQCRRAQSLRRKVPRLAGTEERLRMLRAVLGAKDEEAPEP